MADSSNRLEQVTLATVEPMTAFSAIRLGKLIMDLVVVLLVASALGVAAALIWGPSTDITLSLSKPYWPGRLLLAGSVLLSLIPLAAVLAALSALVQLIAANSTPDNDWEEDDGEGSSA